MPRPARLPITFSVATDEPLFALTLDDGPGPELTPAVLDVLRRHGARATFFLIGSRAHAHPWIVDRIRAEGHEVGNHMWREERAAALTDDEFERSLLAAERALGLGDGPRLLRPGSGLVGRRKLALAERHGYRCVLGWVYPFDAHLRSARWMSWAVRRLLRPGAIVILHEGRPSRRRVLRALDEILADARRRRLTAVPVGELMTSGTSLRDGDVSGTERASQRPMGRAGADEQRT